MMGQGAQDDRHHINRSRFWQEESEREKWATSPAQPDSHSDWLIGGADVPLLFSALSRGVSLQTSGGIIIIQAGSCRHSMASHHQSSASSETLGSSVVSGSHE